MGSEGDTDADAGEIIKGKLEERQAVEKVERITSVPPFEVTNGIEVPGECAVSIGRSIASTSGKPALTLESDIRLPNVDLDSVDDGNITASVCQRRVDKKHAVAV